ncbi:hypothetical protein MSAN_02505000 [Mycena sanguinolenta]|uniref:Uncharacterized protein n=1 Tax=Mycena sanguinolenta TaxID=230812 RepID=A0A8H6U313_9AGAR|nr:hypothetical protein MSAN_02505000 [Mycena sanguinolenta]
MPALPSTIVSTPSLPAAVTYALIVCLALAAFVAFAAAAHLSVRSIRNLKERRTSTLDVEQSVDTTVCSVKEIPEGLDMSRQSTAAATLATARANLPASLKANGIIKICPLNVRMVLAKVAPRCHLKQLREYENPARFDATRRRTTAGPSPLRNVVSAKDIKRASAAAVLAAARARLPATNVTPKAVVVVDLAKVLGNVAPRSQLKTFNREAPAHFGASRTRSRPGSSPLRAVVYAEPEAAPVPVSAPATLPSVLRPSRVGNLARSSPSPAKWPASKTASPVPRSSTGRRLFTGAKENGVEFKFPQAVA